MIATLDPWIRRACLLAAFACALPMLPLLPAWLAAVLVSTAALALFSDKPWPTPLRLLLTAMIGGLVLAAYEFRIGRDTASAGLLAMLMLKPFETHSTRDARSLLGFSLFAPFAAFLQDQGPLTLGLALPAALLSVLAWALLLQPARSPLRPALRRAGMALLMATPMALAGFWLFPRLATPLWGLPDNAVGRMGLGDRMTPNEWLDMLVDDSPALRARFLGPTPPREQMYWRGPVLTRFDGEAWTRDEQALATAPPERTALGTSYAYEVTLEPTERHDLLVLDLPLTVPAESKLNGELTAVTEQTLSSLVRYQGRSAPRARFAQPLPSWQRRVNLALPATRDPRTRALAQQWQRENPDPMALTRRFTDWLRRDFKYTISAPPVGINATDDFLFNTRLGFCQHFSSAYAVFMRAAGVPTRVVTGYVGGHYNRIGDYWLLYRKDAHAWTEIWIEDRGWVRVDPTAAIAPENILDTVDDLQARQQQGGAAGLGDTMLRPIFDGSDFLRQQWNSLVLEFNAARQKSLLRPLGIREAENWQLVAAFAVGAGLALALTLWLLLRQHRDPGDPLLRAWRRFTRRLGRAGLAKAPAEPPLSYAERVAAARPDLAESVRSLSQRYCQWRYAGAEFDAGERRALARELRRFRVS